MHFYFEVIFKVYSIYSTSTFIAITNGMLQCQQPNVKFGTHATEKEVKLKNGERGNDLLLMNGLKYFLKENN